MASMLDERWKPLVGTPSKPAIPSNILVPDPSPARSEVSDTDSPTLLPPSSVCSFIHQRRQGQYVPRPPVWKIDSPNHNGERLIKAGACANSRQEKPTIFDWVLPLPGSDQYDPVQLMADAFNEEPLTVNILTLPETEQTNSIPSTEPVAASRTHAREVDVHGNLHSSVEQAQSPNESPQANQEDHNPLNQSAVGTGESRLAKRHAEVFSNPNPFASKADSAEPRPGTEADPERPNGPFGSYPAGEAEYVETDGVDPPVCPNDSVSNCMPRSSGAGDTARSEAQTGSSYPLCRERSEEVVIGSQVISLDVQLPVGGVLKVVRLNVRVVPGRYTIQCGRSRGGKGADTQAATKVLGKLRGSLGRFRDKVTRGTVGSLKFSKRPRKAIDDVLLRWPPDHPEYIEVNSVPPGAPRHDPPVPAPASQHPFSDDLTSGSQDPPAQQAAQELGTFFEETGPQPASRSGNVQSTYQPTTSSDEDDAKTLLPASSCDVHGRQRQRETDNGQSQDRHSQPASVRSPTGTQTASQSASTQRGGNFSWPLPSPYQRTDLPNGETDENTQFGVAL